MRKTARRVLVVVGVVVGALLLGRVAGAESADAMGIVPDGSGAGDGLLGVLILAALAVLGRAGWRLVRRFRRRG